MNMQISPTSTHSRQLKDPLGQLTNVNATQWYRSLQHGHITVMVFIRAVKRLIAINRIQNKSLYLHNICGCIVYNYFIYINTHTCMYIFKIYFHVYRFI